MSIIESSQAPQSSIWERDYTRRQVLQVSLLAGSAAFLAACGIGSEATKPPEDLDPTEKLFKYLGDLPDLSNGGTTEQQNLKGLLINHASNYFVSPTPRSVNLGGEKILITSGTVISGFTNPPVIPGSPENGYQGVTTFIQPDQAPNYLADDNAILTLPIPNLATASEIAILGPENVFSDGSLKRTVKFEKGHGINMTLAPKIEIDVPIQAPKSEALFREQTGYVKEASTLLTFDLWTTEMAYTLRNLGINSSINVVGPNGKSVETDVFMGMLSTLLAAPKDNPKLPPGRFIALLDLVGYYLMFKALKGTYLRDVAISQNPTWQVPADAADATPAAGNDHDLLTSGIKWALDHVDDWKLNDPKNSFMAHIGDLTKLP